MEVATRATILTERPSPKEDLAFWPQPTSIEELCIHIYKQRKKIPLSSERQVHRPFVSVARNR